MDTAVAGTKENYRILMIEDDPGVRHFLRLALSGRGFDVIETLTGSAGLAEMEARPADLVLLDLGLPDVDGITVTRTLREWTKAPIIVLSGKRRESDKVAALDAGADDYMTKPFGVEELLARIRVALRHTQQLSNNHKEPAFTVGNLRVDLARRRVFLSDHEVSLTPTEYRLLAVLVRHAGTVRTHRQLLQEVWGPQYLRESAYVRIYIQHLRRKLEEDPAQPRFLLSEPGVGYKIAVD